MIQPPATRDSDVLVRPLQGVRVLFVLPSLGLGGAERQAFLLARYLQEHEGAAVHLLGLSRTASMVDACDAANIAHSFFDLSHTYRSRVGHLRDLVRFIRLLRQHRAQVVLPYCMFQNVLCALTWRPAGARVCIWSQRDEGRARLDPWIERIAVSMVRCFISNSQHGASFLTEQLGVAVDRVTVVANGVELPEPSGAETDWRARLGIPAGAPMACMVANLHRKKDHATLVKAWRLVLDRADSALPPHLLLVGRQSDTYEAIVNQVRDLQLGDYVHLVGEVTNVADLLRAVDLAVFSSFNEGVPNAVLEAMAHGLAVVATDYVGIKEAVGDRDAALLAPPRDSEQLAQRILIAMSDPALRARLGQQARMRVAEQFGVQTMASKTVLNILREWARPSRLRLYQS